MNTTNIYHDSDGNECTLYQAVKREPEWAVTRIQEGEKAIEQLCGGLGIQETELQGLRRRIFELEDAIHGMRILEDSYDSETEILSSVFLTLNKICNEYNSTS